MVRWPLMLIMSTFCVCHVFLLEKLDGCTKKNINLLQLKIILNYCNYLFQTMRWQRRRNNKPAEKLRPSDGRGEQRSWPLPTNAQWLGRRWAETSLLRPSELRRQLPPRIANAPWQQRLADEEVDALGAVYAGRRHAADSVETRRGHAREDPATAWKDAW